MLASISFEKRYMLSAKEMVNWLKEHGFSFEEIRESENYITFTLKQKNWRLKSKLITFRDYGIEFELCF